MKTNIFIPEKINVGFQNRSDTYTQKLAYIIYFDQKGVLRKQASWDSWRDKKIDNIIHNNVPTSGFVLNKKAGGYSTGWNHRQTYCRVYDPRDFEFEITIPNLLYILENTNSIKGKGLEGEFVYGWDGKDLILIPTESPDYIEISQFNKILHDKTYIKSKDLILGATYKTKDNQEWIYLGRFDYHEYGENKGKKYYFYNISNKYYFLNTLKSLGDKLISVVSEECVEDYSELMDKLECDSHYSPYDESKDEYVLYEYDRFVEKVINNRWWSTFYYADGIPNTIKIRTQNGYSPDSIYEVFTEVKERDRYWNREIVHYKGTLKEIYDHYQPMYRNKYLQNGKLYQKGD